MNDELPEYDVHDLASHSRPRTPVRRLLAMTVVGLLGAGVMGACTPMPGDACAAGKVVRGATHMMICKEGRLVQGQPIEEYERGHNSKPEPTTPTSAPATTTTTTTPCRFVDSTEAIPAVC